MSDFFVEPDDTFIAIGTKGGEVHIHRLDVPELIQALQDWDTGNKEAKKIDTRRHFRHEVSIGTVIGAWLSGDLICLNWFRSPSASSGAFIPHAEFTVAIKPETAKALGEYLIECAKDGCRKI